MIQRETLKSLLAEMAEIVDKPDGPGGGLILLTAIAEIEDLERLIPPAEPRTS